MKKNLFVLILIFICMSVFAEVKTEVYPAQDMQVNKDTPVYIRFSKAMHPDYINRFTFVLNDGVSDIKGKVVYKPDEKTAYFIPNNYLKPGKNYKAIVYKGVKAEDGDPITKDVIWSFRVIQDNVVVSTLSDLKLDIEERIKDQKRKDFLTVLETIPEDHGVIEKTMPITVKMSAPIDHESVNKYTFMVKNEKRKWEGHLSVRDNSIIFSPVEKFQLDSQYDVIITNFIKDIDGVPLKETYQYTFRTAKQWEDTAPRITEHFPGQNDFGVSPSTSIIVKFNRNMDPSTLNRFNVLLNNGMKNVWGNIRYNEKEKTLVFTPEEELPLNTKCTFRIRENVRDLEGRFLSEDFSLDFSTGTEKVVHIESDRDPEEKKKKETSIEQLQEKIKKQDPDDVFTERYKLKTEDMFFVSEVFPKDRDNGISVDTKIKITFTQKPRNEDINAFSITLSDGVKNIWGDVVFDEKTYQVYFSPKEPLRNNTLYYVRVKDSIKNLKGQNLDRYYEWTFVTEPTPDRQPPEILDVSPGDGEENIASDVGIKIRFDENIREESMNKFTFRVTDGNEYIKTDISYDKEKFIAFVNPVHKLKDGVKYKVIVSQGVSDIAGNFMKQDYSWSFWCGEPPDNTPPQIMTISPRENAPVYTTRPVVSVNFNEEMDTSTLTPFNFGLLEGERPVPGVIEYSSITNTVVYNYFEKLEYGTIYTVFITDRITDVSGNNFPKNIVWDFIISHEKTTMPEVIGSYPMEGKMNFPGTADIVVQWNKDMNPVSFNRFTVKLRDVKGQRIFGDIVYNKENRELKFTPFRKLQYNTRYTLSINRYVQDTEGKNMDESHFLTFYTEGRGHNETEIED